MKFSENHQVKFYECDRKSQMTLPMLLNIVINTSETQSDKIGRSSGYLHQLGITWVITEHEIDILRMPRTNEIITVTTEAKEHNKYFCYRYFWIHDESGNELVKIMTTFVLMDMETRKMISVPDEVIEPYSSEKIKTIKRGEKLPQYDDMAAKEYRVRYSDIDTNQHVNNSRYLDWMTDSLTLEFLSENRPEKVIIRFMKEISYGDLIESCWHLDANPQSISTHTIAVNSVKCAEGMIKWQKENFEG